MENTLYSVKDIKAAHHLPPFISTNDATAIRQFADAINLAGHEMNKYPGDFQLWRIACFESGQATITKNDPQLIAEGLNLVEQPSPIQGA